ncbi:Tad domain-containing protein [Paenibacillus methanolicus]|uniref:Putative Flp pilus-assembly TadE/G-like protein n=1 Tax=Paenibacillus methanolicus TaxID=582686 RepID=A0A5S5BTF9_9BACL|nr:Tad domain-containing protein [Paenibacillus methanolicus]TYP69430.1 putative Flp pilus-assembly TadE/G-like protein [Paenibacillus methanolicus]
MNKRLAAFIEEERGSTIVLAGLSMLLLLTIAGLVVDGGIMYAEKSHLQKTANAAALSGAQELTGRSGAAEAVVQSILEAHGEQGSLISAEIVPMSTVRVKLKKEIGLGFAKLLGKATATVTAEAAARIMPMGRAAGVAPLGIDESITLEYLKPYKLKVDSSGVEAGYFGILALGGPGASTYESNLKYGYPSEIETGDIIDTQTGNVAGKTRDSINLRIDQDPYPAGEFWHRDSSRVILIPVYKPYHYGSNQLKTIEVTGFAYFYILEPMSSKDTAITGMFIERAGTGYAGTDIVNKGAYAIRLIE